MKVNIKQNTGRHHLVVSDLPERLYVEGGNGDQVWIATTFGQLRVSVVGGKTYQVRDGSLVEQGKQVGVRGACHQ